MYSIWWKNSVKNPKNMADKLIKYQELIKSTPEMKKTLLSDWKKLSSS